MLTGPTEHGNTEFFSRSQNASCAPGRSVLRPSRDSLAGLDCRACGRRVRCGHRVDVWRHVATPADSLGRRLARRAQGRSTAALPRATRSVRVLGAGSEQRVGNAPQQRSRVACERAAIREAFRARNSCPSAPNAGVGVQRRATDARRASARRVLPIACSNCGRPLPVP